MAVILAPSSAIRCANAPTRPSRAVNVFHVDDASAQACADAACARNNGGKNAIQNRQAILVVQQQARMDGLRSWHVVERLPPLRRPFVSRATTTDRSTVHLRPAPLSMRVARLPLGRQFAARPLMWCLSQGHAALSQAKLPVCQNQKSVASLAQESASSRGDFANYSALA